jgi:tRNA U34 5-methylaminomethyl-2-thiouridine-forming methyltransferase MnmC
MLSVIKNRNYGSTFKKMYDALKNNGVLVTYAARGVVKSMIEVGFKVEKLAGPREKRNVCENRNL